MPKVIHREAVEHEVLPFRGGGGQDQLPPRGGWGGDDWDKQPQDRRGPRERLKQFRLLISLVVISIFTLFIVLSFAYLWRHSGGTMDASTGRLIKDWRPLKLPSILWFNTLLLALSSFSIEVARRHLFREPAVTEEWLGIGAPVRHATLPWLISTLILGIGFLAGQFSAWMDLHAVVAGGPSAYFFYLLTGAHGVHLLGGLVGVAWCCGANIFGARLSSRQIGVDITAWYWHSLGILWLYIFALLLIFH